MSNGKLLKKIKISGVITAKTGLHIGGSNIGMSIGGADNTVVRNPLSNEPYIPGSSLKGKMRSLLEKTYGQFEYNPDTQVKYNPYVNVTEDLEKDDNKKTHIPSIFGTTPEKMGNTAVPSSRLIVRDSLFTDKTRNDFKKIKTTDMPFTEVKTEVVIDRITSAATPRQLERVPAGAEFEMSLILNIYHNDSEEVFLRRIFESLALVQNDYLGGKGTRGSGEIDIVITSIKKKEQSDYQAGNDWQAYTLPTGLTLPSELKPKPIAVT